MILKSNVMKASDLSLFPCMPIAMAYKNPEGNPSLPGIQNQVVLTGNFLSPLSGECFQPGFTGFNYQRG
jgi:hypothetical protein